MSAARKSKSKIFKHRVIHGYGFGNHHLLNRHRRRVMSLTRRPPRDLRMFSGFNLSRTTQKTYLDSRMFEKEFPTLQE
jgi:hypothetical protein